MKAYETELNNRIYTVIEEKDTVIDEFGKTMPYGTFLDLVKKHSNEGSKANDWTYLDKEVLNLDDGIDNLKLDDENIIIDDDIQTDYNGIKYSYEFLLVRENNGFVLLRELVRKYDNSQDEVLPLYNDNSENGTVSYKHFDKLSNSILWYANEVGAMKYLMENLGYEDLGTRFIAPDGSQLIVPNKQGDSYYIKDVQINFEAHQPKKTRQRKAKEY